MGLGKVGRINVELGEVVRVNLGLEAAVNYVILHTISI